MYSSYINEQLYQKAKKLGIEIIPIDFKTPVTMYNDTRIDYLHECHIAKQILGHASRTGGGVICCDLGLAYAVSIKNIIEKATTLPYLYFHLYDESIDMMRDLTANFKTQANLPNSFDVNSMSQKEVFDKITSLINSNTIYYKEKLKGKIPSCALLSKITGLDFSCYQGKDMNIDAAIKLSTKMTQESFEAALVVLGTHGIAYNFKKLNDNITYICVENIHSLVVKDKISSAHKKIWEKDQHKSPGLGISV